MPTLFARRRSVRRHIARSVALSLCLACVAFSSSSNSSSNRLNLRQGPATNPDLTAHEWGTFTSVADRNGRGIAWLPLSGFYDLPDFVEHFRTADFKTRLRGAVRMETPVLYFYSPRELTLSVKVGFSQGVISEWYPHASRVEPSPKAVLDGDVLYKHRYNGSVAWDSVTLAPGLSATFPRADGPDRYYAAREAESTPLVVKGPAGSQQEKFLFYRGVSTFAVPVSAKATPDGKIQVTNLGADEIPAVVLFERRGRKMGYRMGGAVQREALLDPPELTADVAALSHDLETALISQGLYPAEAHAMVETWSDSWSEEGTRLMYIVPRHFVDTILPLTINPAPAQIVRVFVGRLELMTPATERAVLTALAAHDRYTIFKYGRFLEPIMDQLKEENPAQAQRLDRELSDTNAIQMVAPPSN
jgi:hypothetical protein